MEHAVAAREIARSDLKEALKHAATLVVTALVHARLVVVAALVD